MMKKTEEVLDRELSSARMAVLDHDARARYPVLLFLGFLSFLGGIALLLMNGLRNVTALELAMIVIGTYPTWRWFKHDSERRHLVARVTELETELRQLQWARVAPPDLR
jgi:hypothetical protein